MDVVRNACVLTRRCAALIVPVGILVKARLQHIAVRHDRGRYGSSATRAAACEEAGQSAQGGHDTTDIAAPQAERDVGVIGGFMITATLLEKRDAVVVG